MRLAMTLMVRDEIDIVGAMLDHHLAQGVDTIIVTDNGSADGTAELLSKYAARGQIVLHHDPVHRKQQSEVVTAMAREAATEFDADWVLNADADEFWLARTNGLSLHDAFEHIPRSVQAFDVHVYDLIGAPAGSGSGLQRLVYRDLRPDAILKDIGLHAHSTHDAAHVGDPAVVVAQGNHFVNIKPGDPVPAGFEIEVLHLPWRSWGQYSRKVRNAGEAYEASPTLTPSPNHHGMRDYRRLKANTLRAYYVARHPTPEEVERGLVSGDFVHETRLSAIESPQPDTALNLEIAEIEWALGRALAAAESQLAAEHEKNRILSSGLQDMRAQNRALDQRLQLLANRRSVRWSDAVARRLRRG